MVIPKPKTPPLIHQGMRTNKVELPKDYLLFMAHLTPEQRETWHHAYHIDIPSVLDPECVYRLYAKGGGNVDLIDRGHHVRSFWVFMYHADSDSDCSYTLWLSQKVWLDDAPGRYGAMSC